MEMAGGRPGAGTGRSGWCIGLMTGTALDGEVDVALVRTDGRSIEAFGHAMTVPYGAAERAVLAEAVQAAIAWDFDGPEPASLATAETLVTDLYAKAVEAAIAASGLPRSAIVAVGGHGVTVLHRPDRKPVGATRQLLDGQRLADRLGLTVVCDFRSADVAAGGQGAPLAPVYHAAALQKAGVQGPAAFLNLGGVGNLTWWPGAGQNNDGLIAFDTGPANGPINEWIEAHGRGLYDADGAFAAAGRVNEGRLLEILDNPWFDLPPPKSLDRYDFSASLVRGMSLEDGAATLTALCAATVALGLLQLPGGVTQVVVGGGCAHNPVMMAELNARCGVPLVPAAAVGLNGDATEAECFAFLACRTLAGLPLSYPGTTGVEAPASGGTVFQPVASHLKPV